MASLDTMPQDAEMVTVRRSTRVVHKPKTADVVAFTKSRAQKKRTTNTKKTSKSKSIRKSTTKVKQPASRTSRRKATKRIKSLIDKFADLSRTKISDMFCLVKKYAIMDDERQGKYAVLQTVLKGMKENQVQNTLVDLHTHKHKLACYVVNKLLPTSSPMCFTRVCQHIDDMLAYKEVDGVDCIQTSNVPTTLITASSQEMMDTDTSALQEGIDALDALQSIFRRLIV